MVVAETFWQVIWTMFIFFAWILWIWLLIVVFSDLFRRHDTSGWAKAAWMIFIIFVPLFGVLIYLIAEGKQMGERRMKDVQAAQANFDAQVKAAAGSGDPTEQISKAKQLLDSGAITQAEFEAIKQKALA
jgi:hypothetical protein